MRERLCKVCRGWHTLDGWPEECLPPRPERSAFPVPMMNLDSIPAVKSMVDGLYYDSKATLRRSYKAAGVIEVGNEVQKPLPLQQPKSNPEAIVTAMKRTGVWDELRD